VHLPCKKKRFSCLPGLFRIFCGISNFESFCVFFPRFLAEPWSGSTALKCQSQGRHNEFTCRHRAAYWLLLRRLLIVSELVNWRRSVWSTSFVFSTRRTLNPRWRTAQKDGPDDILRIRWFRISNLGPETR